MKKAISEVLQQKVDDLRRHDAADADANLGDQLKAFRRERDLTQEQFARIYDLRLGSVRNWEQSARGLPDHTGRLMLKMILANPDQMAELVRRTRRAKVS